MADNDVAALAVLIIFGAPVAAWVIIRVMAHRERLEMIRHGMMPPGSGRPQAGPFVPPGVGSVPPPYTASAYFVVNEDAQCQLRKGIRIALIGLALVIGLSFINPGYPGPWLLGGLIPMFVGIAQIINAVLNGARFGPPSSTWSGNATSGAPNSTEPRGVGAPPPPTAGRAYAWRPGSLPEIEKPPSPPDQR